jgi:Spy/CpxP family protein refolding chaperone
MKHIIPAALAAAIMVLPLGAVAGEPSASEHGGPMGPGMYQKLGLTSNQQQACQQVMTQTHQQMEQLHAQARAKVLAALTPAHRALLAQIVGSLAIAPNPDPDAAAKQLNAALSPGEAQAVVSTHTAAMQQMHAIMTAAHQRFQAILTPQQRAQIPSEHEMGDSHDKEMREMSQLTAGQILMHFAQPEEMHSNMEMGHPM